MARFSVLPAKTRSPLDWPNATCHRFNYHTNPTARTPSVVCAFICAYRTKTEPTWLGFQFCQPKHAPHSIGPTQCATTSNTTSTALHALPLGFMLLFARIGPKLSPHGPVFTFADRNPPPARSLHPGIPPPPPPFPPHPIGPHNYLC